MTMPRSDFEVSPGTYHIDVTNEDILKGVRGDGSSCAIARAVKRALDLEDAEIDGSIISIGYLRGEGPDSIDAFIATYDSAGRVEPFAFDLTLEPTEPLD